MTKTSIFARMFAIFASPSKLSRIDAEAQNMHRAMWLGQNKPAIYTPACFYSF